MYFNKLVTLILLLPTMAFGGTYDALIKSQPEIVELERITGLEVHISQTSVDAYTSSLDFDISDMYRLQADRLVSLLKAEKTLRKFQENGYSRIIFVSPSDSIHRTRFFQHNVYELQVGLGDSTEAMKAVIESDLSYSELASIDYQIREFESSAKIKGVSCGIDVDDELHSSAPAGLSRAECAALKSNFISAENLTLLASHVSDNYGQGCFQPNSYFRDHSGSRNQEHTNQVSIVLTQHGKSRWISKDCNLFINAVSVENIEESINLIPQKVPTKDQGQPSLSDELIIEEEAPKSFFEKLRSSF